MTAFFLSRSDRMKQIANEKRTETGTPVEHAQSLYLCDFAKLLYFYVVHGRPHQRTHWRTH